MKTIAIAVAAWGSNCLDIFGLGTDDQMYHKAWSNAWFPSPTDWEPLGGKFDSPPAVAAWGSNRLDIFGLGTDDQMYHKAWDGNAWFPSPTGWEPLGGKFDPAPRIGGFVSPGTPTSKSWHSDVTFSDSTPLGGWVDFVADNTERLLSPVICATAASTRSPSLSPLQL